jgi:hypothetical protein
MVPEDHPGEAPKKSRHYRGLASDTLFACGRRVYAGHNSRTDATLRAGVVTRTNEHILIDGIGVVLVKDGKRHVLHLWGTVPSIHLPH